MAYLSEASKAALTAAVASIERRSSAEVVIAVRVHSGSMLVADLIAGVLAASSTLAFLLFSPVPFSLPAIWLDTLVFGALGALLCSRFPGLRRVLTPRSIAAAQVRAAACAEFFEGGLGGTRGRTGILIYVSQTERAAEVRQERDGVKLATVIEAIAEPLAACLPCAADDVNELDDRVRAR